MRSVLFLVVTGLCTALQAQSAESPLPDSQQMEVSVPAAERTDVVAIASVKARDASGRVSRFADARGHEFEAAYDADGRIISAKASLGEHVSQVTSVGYDTQGRLVGALIGVSYVLSVSYSDDGTQVIRDRFGALIARRGDFIRGYQVIQVSDPSGRLLRSVQGLDALMRDARAPQ